MILVLAALAKNIKNAMANYFIGLISGTSIDGIDGVIVDESCKKIISSISNPYPSNLKKNIRNSINKKQITFDEFANLDIQTAKHFSQTVKLLLQQQKIALTQIKAIGSHGQTIYHNGGQYSIQIGHGALIAEQTNITTVSDFRMQDIAAGGQGAPLATIYHKYMLDTKKAVLLNLGGIANITKFEDNKIIGFDTGPANTLLDNWIKKNKNVDYDKKGEWASSGVVNKDLLKKLLNDKYFKQDYPKSTGVEYFNLYWLEQILKSKEKPENIQRTLLELTAKSISKHIPKNIDVYLCGGGAHNLFLVNRLKQLNPDNVFSTTKKLGIHPDFVEAAAFSFFAKQRLSSKPLDLTTITGAKKNKMLLGVIYPQ